MSNFDQKVFENELHDPNLYEQIELTNCSNNAYNIFHKKFLALLNKHAPFRFLTKKEMNIRKKPWLTKGILTGLPHVPENP